MKERRRKSRVCESGKEVEGQRQASPFAQVKVAAAGCHEGAA